MSKILFGLVMWAALFTSDAGATQTGRAPVCTNGKIGPPTISLRDNGMDPRYGYYCGRANRCPASDPNCQPCDAVDLACMNHDACWSAGACAAPAVCDISTRADLARRDALPEWMGKLTPQEKAMLAQMRSCDDTLCSQVRSVTSVNADQNEARGMPQSTFGCNPRLLPVIGGVWKSTVGGTPVTLVQTGNQIKGSYGGGPGHPNLFGTITGNFDGTTFNGEYENREGSISGKGRLTWTFTTDYSTGTSRNLPQDKLDGKWDGITFPNQHGTWVMTRD